MDELLLTCWFRVNFSAQRLRIRMRLMLRLASSARLRLSRGGNIVSVVLIRRMVRVMRFLRVPIELTNSVLACAMCGKNLAGKSTKDQPVVQGQKFNMK